MDRNEAFEWFMNFNALLVGGALAYSGFRVVQALVVMLWTYGS